MRLPIPVAKPARFHSSTSSLKLVTKWVAKSSEKMYILTNICWHHRWMIPPLGREHSHDKTQYIPGKQVLVNDCGKQTNKNILQILLVYSLDCTKWYSSMQAKITCVNSTTTLQCIAISQLPMFLQLDVPLLCSALSYRLSEYSLVHVMITCSSVH